MKKKICAAAVIVFFLITFAFSVYKTSADSLFNINNDLNELTFPVDELSMINWNGSEENFTSGEDPQIVVSGVDCYVHSITIVGSFDIEEDTIQLFYTTEENEPFSEEKSGYIPYYVNGGRIYFYADRDVRDIRIDICPHAGTDLFIKKIKINDRTPLISLNLIAAYCVIPTGILALVLFLALYHKQLGVYVLSFRKFVPLLKNLISRDLKVKYRRSVLGFMWSILNPLLMALVFNAVFSRIFRFQVEYYASYYLTGSLIFSFIAEATSASMTSVLGAAPLIKKVYIPKYIFPLEKCVFAFINMLFSSVALAVIMIIQGVPFSPTVFLGFIPMIYAFVFAYGLGLMLAAFTVFFRDIEHLYSVLTTVWMYLTPIIYPEQMLVNSGLSVVLKLNPMYYFIHSFRNAVMYGALPTTADNVMCTMFAMIFLCGGLAAFKKLQDRFILYI